MRGIGVDGGLTFPGHRTRLVVAALASLVALAVGPDPSSAADGEGGEVIRRASAAYVAAFNTGDFTALADQWTERATLREAGVVLSGRSAIVAALRAWREQHPKATLAIKVSAIEMLAESLARVEGTMEFTPRAGAKATISRFTSLRAREGDVWRLVESIVIPEHAAALDDLDWLIGTWTAETDRTTAGGKTTVEITYEKPLGPYCIVGRGRIKPREGDTVESLEVIHADRATGLVRCWVYDSTGARGEGVVTSDGTTFHKEMAGHPADRLPGRLARWTQVIAPTGEGRCTLHSIERSVDDVPLPDGDPLHFRKVR